MSFVARGLGVSAHEELSKPSTILEDRGLGVVVLE